jgi:hypothetical protein
MTELFTRNGKLKKASAYTVNFGIPALKTCPMKDICGKYCYANKGAYVWPQVKQAYEYRFEQTKKANFTELAIKALSKKRKLQKVRIHDSGDFYNKEYLYKWFKIAESMPNIEFYAYTKQVKLLKDNWSNKPSNLTIIFSLGGRQDNLIDQKVDRHSKIFKTLDELNASGYINTSDDDSNAVNPDNNKIGLVIH